MAEPLRIANQASHNSFFSLEGIKVLSLINQVGFSGSFEESKSDDSYRNDPMKYVDTDLKRNQEKEILKKQNQSTDSMVVFYSFFNLKLAMSPNQRTRFFSHVNFS